MHELEHEIAATAARLIVEEGLDYGVAKRRARDQLGLPTRTGLPSNDQLETQVREYIAIFYADSQPRELHALREQALLWMERLADFRPHLSGCVWHGTATRLTDIRIGLFCDDPKSAEITLINQGVRYETSETTGLSGRRVSTLSIHSHNTQLQEDIGVHLIIYTHDELRGSLKPDSQGRKPRGNIADVRRLLVSLND